MIIDLKQLEQSAMDTYSVAGLLGCLIMALREDSATEPVGQVLCWQIKESLQIAYNILERTSLNFMESVEILERSSVVKGQGEAETP